MAGGDDGDDGPGVYSDDFIANLELLWGEGFLSPGGAEEIAELFRGADLTGARVLNFGSGLGAMDRLLARDHGAARVLGIDIEAQLVERASAAARREGLADRVAFQLVTPGPLPFAEAAFDVVTSKDAIIYLEDKRAIYAELLRVLRPGGRLMVSDWFGGAPPYSEETRAWIDASPGHYFLETIESVARMAESLGFVDIETRDRNAWYRDMIRDEWAGLTGPKRARLLELVGEKAAAAFLERTRNRMAAVETGDLRPGHLRARKPG